MSIDLQRLYEKERHFLNLFVDDEELPVEDFVGQHVAILGKSGAGKSVTNAVLMEEYASTGIVPLIFDTEGDYHTLAYWRPHKFTIYRSFKVTRRKTIPAKRDKKGNVKERAKVEKWTEWNYSGFNNVVDRILGRDMKGNPVDRSGVVVLINRYGYEDRLEIIYQILNRFWNRVRAQSKPEAIGVLVDEAHEKIPQSRASHNGLVELLKDMAKQGRKQGVGLVLSTQRPAEIQKTALAQCGFMFALKVDEHRDVEAYKDRLPLGSTASDIKKRIWGECRYFPPGRCYFKYPSNDENDAGIKIKQVRWRHSSHPTQTPGEEALVEW